MTAGSSPPTGEHAPPGIGHNGPPVTARQWLRIIGPRVVEVVRPFKAGAPWTRYARDAELRRLGKLQARIERKEAALAALRAERHTIMRRCITRMRRASHTQRKDTQC